MIDSGGRGSSDPLKFFVKGYVKMRIELVTGGNGEQKRINNIEVEPNTTAEALYEEYKDAVGHSCYAVLVDNKIEPFDYVFNKESKVEFLDVTNKQAHLIYQSSLTMLLLKASKDIAGADVRIEVRASINAGLYVCYNIDIDEDTIAQIYRRMKELSEADIRITGRKMSRMEAKHMLAEDGLEDDSRLIEHLAADDTIRIYTLGNYSEFFYNYLVPSTGYLDKFEVMKYRDGLLIRYPQPSDPERVPPFVDDYIVYNAFVEQMKWNELMGIRYVSDLNDKIENSEGARTMVSLSEALHDKKIVEIADRITKEGKRMILILGPSSSGKTTFSRRLIIQLMVNGLKPLYIGTDDYFVERENTPTDADGEYDFESIKAVDTELFNKDMSDLLAGRQVDLPVFDFKTGHKKFGTRMRSISDDQPILVEGIHAFNPMLTGEIDDEEKFRIYISPLTQINIDAHNRIPTTDTRIIRRMIRDYRTRNHNATETLRQWNKVHEAENVNIFPYTYEADIFFNSAHIYEIAVLKKYAEPLLNSVPDTEPEYAEAVRLLRELKYVKTMRDDSCINNDSIIREFIGGGMF